MWESGPHAHAFLQSWSFSHFASTPPISPCKKLLEPHSHPTSTPKNSSEPDKSELSEPNLKGRDEENDILGRELIHNDAALALAAFTKNENAVRFREDDRGLGAMLTLLHAKKILQSSKNLTR